MNKYINIILLSFFGVYLLKYDTKLSLFFPVLFFYMYNNKKSMWLTVPITCISLLLYDINLMPYIPIIVLILIMAVYSLFIKKKKTYINLLFIMIVNYISLLVLNSSYNYKGLLMYLIYTIISAVIYLILEVNYNKILFKNGKFKVVEIITSTLVIVSTLGLKVYQINISLGILIFYSMYYAKNKSYFELIINMITSYLLIGSNPNNVWYDRNWISVVMVGVIYLIDEWYYLLTLLLVMVYVFFFNSSIISRETTIMVVGISLFFELFKTMFVFSYDEDAFILKTYQEQIERINSDVLSYASFLDSFSKRYVESKDYQHALNQGVETIINNYCNVCYKRDECFKKNKGKIHSLFKDLLLYGTKNDFESLLDGYCPTLIEMRKSSILINQKLNINEEYKKKNSLVVELNGISSILRRYTISNSLIKEIDYNKINIFKKRLVDSGLNVIYFSPMNLKQEELIIEMGFLNTSYSDIKELCEKLAFDVLDIECSLVYKEAKITKTYVKLVPKIGIEVSYGYAILADNGNNICGDNFMIKTLSDSRLVSVICDGMGKGLNANAQSSELIKIIDEVVSLPIERMVGLSMLNTLYNLEGYLDKYSTLDYLEINRSKKEAVFYKMGAASSYVFKQGKKLEKIENSSLPFGLEESSEEKVIKLEDKDIIIMTSDGIIDNVIEEESFEKYISKINHLTSQKMAYEIISYANKCNVKASDDKCVIVLKIDEVKNC